jgi:allantoinase
MPKSSQVPDSFCGDADLIVRGRRVITPDGERSAAIHVQAGVIAAIAEFDNVRSDHAIYEAGDLVVMPGLVDTHVHINEPGRAEWEGFTTATRAAAAGGITTLIEMPLNSIPATTSLSGFQEKVSAAMGKVWVDTGFWGGLVPGNADELGALWNAGCFGFKCFLVDSGVDEFPPVMERDLREGLAELARINAPLLAHAELPGPIEEVAASRPKNVSRRAYETWLASRPRAAENVAISLLLRLGREFGVHIHIVHLSSSDAIPQVQQAKSSPQRVSAETCPHYLSFAAEAIPGGATLFKCAPPIREAKNREQLWAALGARNIDMIVTDHSPCLPTMKHQEDGDFMAAWGGIASLQISLPAVWTEARVRSYSLTHVAKWMCEGPARLAGLEKKKGAIAVGHDADLVIWNPDAAFRVDPLELQHRHKITPYAGCELVGIVEATFLRGTKIYERGEFCVTPAGRILLRGKS